jgi:hypothetical protein
MVADTKHAVMGDRADDPNITEHGERAEDGTVTATYRPGCAFAKVIADHRRGLDVARHAGMHTSWIRESGVVGGLRARRRVRRRIAGVAAG